MVDAIVMFVVETLLIIQEHFSTNNREQIHFHILFKAKLVSPSVFLSLTVSDWRL